MEHSAEVSNPLNRVTRSPAMVSGSLMSKLPARASTLGGPGHDTAVEVGPAVAVVVMMVVTSFVI